MTAHRTYCVAFRFPGKDNAILGSDSFSLPDGAMFHEVEARAAQVFRDAMRQIFPAAMVDAMPDPEHLRIVPGQLVLMEDDE